MTNRQEAKRDETPRSPSRPRPVVRTGVRAGVQDGDDYFLRKRP